MVGKPSDKKLLLGGAIASIVIGGGAYYYYRSKSSKDGDKVDLPTDTLPVAKSEEAVVSGEVEPKVDAQGMKERGNKYFKGGKFSKAIECYSKAIELCTEDNITDISTYYQNRAAANEQLKDWASVVNDCSLAIEKNPKYTKALHRRAKAYEELGEKLSCLDDATAVCLLEQFSNQNCLILYQRILRAIGKEKATEYYPKRPPILPSASSIYNYLDSFNNNIFDVPEDEDESIDSGYMKILDKMKQRDFTEVVSMCGEVMESGGKHAHRARLLRGTLLTLMNEQKSAIDDFDKIIDAEDTDGVDELSILKVDALIKRGSLKMQLEDAEGCYDDFTKAIAIDEQNPNIYHNRGQLYFFTDRIEEAKSEFKKAISLDPSYIAPRIQLGQCLFKTGMQSMAPTKIKEANDLFEETILLFPESCHSQSIYGQLLMGQQRYEEAMEKFEKAISLSPTTAESYVHKGSLLFQWKQDVEGAVTFLKKAIETDAKCDIAYETLAMLQVQKNDLEDGIKTFERSLELVRTEEEMMQIFSLMEAAKAQLRVTREYGIQMPMM